MVSHYSGTSRLTLRLSNWSDFRGIEKDSHKWKDMRRKRLLTAAPCWALPKAKNAATRLVEQCLEGNAWQADHITPVYKGGGLCDIDNLRTLCTLCHQV